MPKKHQHRAIERGYLNKQEICIDCGKVLFTKKQKAEIIDKLKMLDGFPPHNEGGNFLMGDGYFANSIERKYGMPLSQLQKEVGYDKIAKRINSLLKQAARIK